MEKINIRKVRKSLLYGGEVRLGSIVRELNSESPEEGVVVEIADGSKNTFAVLWEGGGKSAWHRITDEKSKYGRAKDCELVLF
mgnify:CR=1 FL=1